MIEKQPLIAAIAAVSANGVIGKNGGLPWDIPEESAYFEAMTQNTVRIIGRRTYDSMPVVPPDSVIISRQRFEPRHSGCFVVGSVEEAVKIAKTNAQGREIRILGGAEIYAKAWRFCQRFYLTRLAANFEGDTFLPPEIPFDDWSVIEVSAHRFLDHKSKHFIDCHFWVYQVAEIVSATP